MKFLLDTNAVIAFLKGSPRLNERLRSHAPADCVISSIVSSELYFGAFRSIRTAENLARIGHLRFPIVELDREDAIEAGRIRAQLTSLGMSIGP